MPKTSRLDIRATDEDRAILTLLANHLGISRSATVWQLVREKAREEGIGVNRALGSATAEPLAIQPSGDGRPITGTVTWLHANESDGARFGRYDYVEPDSKRPATIAVIVYHDGGLFTTTDWDAPQPLTQKGIADCAWMDPRTGQRAIVQDGWPRLALR
jgi:hypothetical protein